MRPFFANFDEALSKKADKHAIMELNKYIDLNYIDKTALVKETEYQKE